MNKENPTPIFFNEKDLALVRSIAIQIMQDYPQPRHNRMDDSDLRTLCYATATLAVLKNKGILNNFLEFRKEDTRGSRF